MFTTIIIFILVLGILVLVHEYGHFIAARKLGVKVHEFAIGFPPRITSFIKKGTRFSINWIPLGGFVKLKGEAGDEKDDPDSFAHKSPWKRIVILSAGVAMNFVLAIVLLSVGFMVGIPQEVTDEDVVNRDVRDIRIVIAEVAINSPAEAAGVQVGDTLLSINGETFITPDNVVEYIAERSDEELSVVVGRGANEVTLTATPAIFGDYEKPLLGISMLRAGLVQYGFFESILKGFQATGTVTYLVLAAFGGLLVGIFTGGGDIVNQISGPVGVAVLTGQVAQLGIPYLLNFTAMLSINLGILNIIPFPALDGGRILFVILEKIKGRPISPKIENIFHTAGFSLLILLVIFVTFRDFTKYGELIWRGVTSIFS